MPTPTAARSASGRSTLARVLWVAALAAWSVGVCAGIGWSLCYDAAPGAAPEPPAQWPDAMPGATSGAMLDGTPLVLDPERLTLVLFAHPHCACTHATLTELDRLLARCHGRVAPWVLFYADPALGEGWERTTSWDRAAAIPGVRLATDSTGTAARRFGAATSGTVLLYAPDGRLRFHGGITASRGHEGDNAGATSIVELASTGATATSRTAVYGCSLVAAAEPSR